MKQHVYVLDSALVPHTNEIDVERNVLQDCATVHLLHMRADIDFEPYLENAAAVILWHQVDFTAQIIRKLTNVKIIVRNGVGFENVDINAAAECGIPVSNVPDYGTEEVADHTIALCLALNRQLRILMDDVFKGNWRYQAGIACHRARGRLFGIVGCGRIGTATALRAKAFGYKVCFYDPYLAPGYEKAIAVSRVDTLDELLNQADVVSLHVPLTDETMYMIDVPQMKRMKHEAYLINTSRGPVVRYAAVEQALAEQWISGVGMDVLEHEPEGAELATRYPNCIITPHSAFYSQESFIEMRRSAARTVREALLAKKWVNVVNNVKPPCRV